MRVGRAPLDAEAIRLIEAHHPQIRFDWPQILNGEEEVFPPEPPARGPDREPPPPAPVGASGDAAARPVGPVAVPMPDEPLSPAHARLGSEGLARLRARHADVVASIQRRTPDEERRKQLLEQASRLDPDTWVTDGEVAQALEEYETILASLRDVVGRRRRRKRPRPGGRAEGGGSGEPADSERAQDVDSPQDGPPEDPPEDNDPEGA